jgi:hypothetical protein
MQGQDYERLNNNNERSYNHYLHKPRLVWTLLRPYPYSHYHPSRSRIRILANSADSYSDPTLDFFAFMYKAFHIASPLST